MEILPAIKIKRLPIGEHKIDTFLQLPPICAIFITMAYILPFTMTVRDIATEKENRLKVF